MALPPGFACEGKWHVVYRLHQAIYGLKTSTLTSKGARKQQARKALYIILVKPKRPLLI